MPMKSYLGKNLWGDRLEPPPLGMKTKNHFKSKLERGKLYIMKSSFLKNDR